MGNGESEKPKSIHKRTFYFLNILFMCVITIASLAMAVICFVRLERLRAEKEIDGTVYTDAQIEKIRYTSGMTVKNNILLQIQSSFESGNSTISMLRELYPDDLVVMWEGRYYFYPVDRNLERNVFGDEDFDLGENGFMEYLGENEAVAISRGIDVSSLNGEIDWGQVAGDGISFVMLRAACRDSEGELVIDEMFEENLSGAKSAGLRAGCYVNLDVDSEEAAKQMAQFILDNLSMSKEEMGAPIAVRVQIPDHTSSLSQQTREEWTQSVRAFCKTIRKAGCEPLIYANTAAFNLLLNMSELEEYGKWLSDYGDYLYFPYKFDYWQYSIKGSVPGIEGDVPLDLHVTVAEE